MEQQSNFSLKYISNITKIKLKNIFFSILIATIIFRIGSFIPVPCVNTFLLSKLIKNGKVTTVFKIFDIFSGGVLHRFSIFSLGVMPYIYASITIQFLNILYPLILGIKNEKKLGKNKISDYTNYLTLLLSILQSVLLTYWLLKLPLIKNLKFYSILLFCSTVIISLVCGSMFLIWLGEQIENQGIYNGIFVIIFIDILSRLPNIIYQLIKLIKQSNLYLFLLILVILFVFFVIFTVVYIESSQRRIFIHYIRNKNNYRGSFSQRTYLPIKINISGFIPIIFAYGVIFFINTILTITNNILNYQWLLFILFYLQPGRLLYFLIFILSIIIFCFCYNILILNSEEISKNLKKSGAFIPGIRPGEQTSKYVSDILYNLTSFNTIYLIFISLVPEFINKIIHMPFYFSGTSLLIVVLIIIDFISQIQNLIISGYYQIILNKTNFKKH